MSDLEALAAYHAGDERMNIDLTRCPNCHNKWIQCTCLPVHAAILEVEREDYERRIAKLEARIAALERRLDEQSGDGK